MGLFGSNKHRPGDAVELENGRFARVTDKKRNGLIEVQETDGAGNSNGNTIFVKEDDIRAQTEFRK